MTNYTEDGLNKLLKKGFTESIILLQQRKIDLHNVGWLIIRKLNDNFSKLVADAKIATKKKSAVVESS